jgi:hypothetical protein
VLSEPRDTNTDTRQNDLEVLQKLRAQQQSLVEYFSQNEDTIEKKVNDLGQIIEDRMKYADPLFLSEGLKDFTISQISTYIANLFRSKGIKSADNVHHYLPSKWKDASQIRNNVIESRGTEYREVYKSLVYLTDNQSVMLQVLEDARKTQPSLISNAHELFHDGNIRTEKIAFEEGIPLGDNPVRKEHKTPTERPRITTLWEAVRWGREGPLLKFQNFTQKFPPPPELEEKWAGGFIAFCQLFESVYNEKFSLTGSMWFSKIKYMIHHSKHGAGVKDQTYSMLCEVCYDKKAGEDRPGCNSEMIWDWHSPTNWRCTSCNGIVGHLRGLTREQVGDNKSPILTQAEYYANNLPFFYDLIEFYVRTYMPRGYARKIDLGVDLSNKA